MTEIVGSLRERFHEPEHDPPEPWERLAEAGTAVRRRRGLAEHPYAPQSWAEVPRGAAEALESACGAWRLDQVFVVPAATRRLAGDRDAWVVTPMQVLGLADEGVALWADAAPEPGVVAVIPLDELAAIDHVQIQQYARLTLLAPRRRLTIRYDAVARRELEGQLSRVRAAAAGCPLPVPDEPEPDLPHAWAHVVRSAAVSLWPGAPIAVRLGMVSARGASPRTGLIALSPHELIVAQEPDPEALENSVPWAHDLLAVPRQRLDAIERVDGGARLRAGAVEIDVALSPPFADELVAFAGGGREP